MKTGYRLNMYNNISWNTGLAAERARHNLKKNKKKKKKNKSTSPQAGGPAHKESGCKPSSVFPTGNVNWFKKKMDRDQA